MADEKKVRMTGADTHRATQRGFAINPVNGAGALIEEGELVPADQPVSEEWMEPVKKADRALMGAVEEGQEQHKRDVDYTALNLSALQAIAAERGINPGKLGKDDLITAIKAADDPLR